MLKQFLTAIMFLMVAVPAFGNEAPAAERAPAFAEELPVFEVPSLGYLAGKARQDADSDYQKARKMFSRGRVLGLLGTPVAVVGAFLALLGAITTGGPALGLIIMSAGGLMVVAGAALGQMGWLYASKAAALRKAPGPPKGLGFVSMGLVILGGVLAPLTPGALGGLALPLAWLLSELQQSTTHRYWNGASSRRRGLNVQLHLAPNGLIGRF